MLALMTAAHLIIGIALVFFVLMQDPKDGAAGMFGGGGSSSTFFGSSGATSFLETGSKWLAGLFAISCLALTWTTTHRGSSVMDAAGTTTTAPATNKATTQTDATKAAAPAATDKANAKTGTDKPAETAPKATAPKK